jgi:glycyl-tRNA synthetase beta chain
VEQVNCLVEWPSAVLCSFGHEFLAVPQEALIATMETHQKFFPVLDHDGRLVERFIGIANIESKDVSQVRQGYERVIRPRFSDAKFFFDADLKQGLASMNEGLKSVTYQAKLRSVAEKVARIAALAEIVATEVGEDPPLARRAAELSKADLQSRLVNEFPELQGVAGRYYASVDASLSDLPADKRNAVAAAIDESYMPRFANDSIAQSKLGQVLAIADRLDTLSGGFIADLKPTGNKDPFALRRTALGLARNIIEAELELDLGKALYDAADFVTHSLAFKEAADFIGAQRRARTIGVNVESDQVHQFTTASPDATAREVYAFIVERLRGYYADQGVPPQQFESVATLRPASLLDFDHRLKAIGEFAKLPEAAALAAANKRIRNILRKVEGVIPSTLDASLLTAGAEQDLADAVDQAIADTNAALQQHDYVAVLGRLARLRPQVDAFFDGVMVNVDDVAVRNNRLALLQRLADRLGSVAAIEHLSS